MRLITTENAKTPKGEKYGYLTGILYLAPYNTAVKSFNVCPNSTAGCRKACLFTAGRGRMNNIVQSRVAKTRWLHDDRKGFLRQLCVDIQALKRRAERARLKPCIRLNGTSDLSWHKSRLGKIPQLFPSVIFYDYTKDCNRLYDDLPDNYSLTFSYNGFNTGKCIMALNDGHNVAAVFRGTKLPDRMWGFPVIDGDNSDLRFLDPTPSIIGLKAKGRAIKINSPFILDA